MTAREQYEQTLAKLDAAIAARVRAEAQKTRAPGMLRRFQKTARAILQNIAKRR